MSRRVAGKFPVGPFPGVVLIAMVIKSVPTMNRKN